MTSYHKQNGVDIRVVRIFNTYGPRMLADDGRVVSNFIVQALRGEAITIYGDGSQTRSFCYVDDLVNALIMMMECDDFTGPVNLGNPVEFTILELAKRVQALINSDLELVYKPLPEDDPVQRQPDITLARRKLGWQPHIAIDEGIVKTIDYFREILGFPQEPSK
jgi:UDP-glucuronate decarboxylase